MPPIRTTFGSCRTSRSKNSLDCFGSYTPRESVPGATAQSDNSSNVFHSRDHGRCRAKTIYDWKSILKLADMWKFRDVYNLAVRKLSQLPLVPVEKIGLMHRHHIRKEWVLDALVALVTQPTFPSYFDTQVIGLEMTTQLAHAREEYRAALIRPTSYATATVRRVFGLRDDLGVPSSWEANVPIN